MRENNSVFKIYLQNISHTPKKILVYSILSMMMFSSLNAQHFTHDVGFHFGNSAFITDYGVRNDYQSSFGNVGASISFTHTVHFFNRDLRWNADHKIWSYLALRSEINIVTKTNLKHHGPFVEREDLLGRQLRAMTGSVSMMSFGFQLEYYGRCLRDFSYPWSDIKWNPYFLVGLKYNVFKNDLNSTLGNWLTDTTVLPTKWAAPGALSIGKGNTLSASIGGGLRYKLTPKIDLNTQLNWQCFFSDAVDGLQAKVPENQNNESLINFQVGVILHLNFNNPLRIFN